MKIKALNPFSDRTFISRLWKLTAPMMLQGMMLALIGVCDTLMLGNVEQNAMSAVSLATQIQFVQNIIMSALTAAMAVLTAQYWGKKDRSSVQDVLAIGVRSCGCISLVFFAGCAFFPEVLMSIFTDADVLVKIGSDYLRIAGWSYLMTGISQPFMTVFKSAGHQTETAKISSCTVLLNIFLNGVLIFGWFGLPRLEVVGAAIATLICRVVELIWVLIVSKKEGFIDLPIKKLASFKRLLSKDFIKCMLPLLGACLFWGVGFVSYSAFMGHMGTDAVAANSVASMVRDLVCCMCDGLSAGCGVLIGNELGAGHLKQGKEYGDKTVVIAFAVGIASTIIMLAATPVVIHMVKLTEAAASCLIGMMLIMAFYMIGRAVNTIVINGIFAAGGDTMFDLYSLAVTMWGIAVPLAALGTFVFHWPPLLVYACTCLDEVGKIPWVMAHYRRYRWVKDLTRDFDRE